MFVEHEFYRPQERNNPQKRYILPFFLLAAKILNILTQVYVKKGIAI